MGSAMSADTRTDEELLGAARNGDEAILAECRDLLEGKRPSVEAFARATGADGWTTG
jgi:hypothetical protein